MQTETQAIDYFKKLFRNLSERRKSALRDGGKIHPQCRLQIETETTFNIACEVLGGDVAGQMADDSKL